MLEVPQKTHFQVKEIYNFIEKVHLAKGDKHIKFHRYPQALSRPGLEWVNLFYINKIL